MKPFRHVLRTLVLTLVLTGFCVSAGFAEPAPQDSPQPAVTMPSAAAPYTGVWVDKSATVTDETLQQMLDGIAQQQADPQQIVILIHGFATSRAESAKQYAEISKRVVEQFQKLGVRVAVVGLQWDSYVGPPKMWVEKVLKATLGMSDENPYLQKVALARNVGCTAGRQMVIAIQNKFPSARRDVFAHSLGSDVTRNTFAWKLDEKYKKPKGAPEPTDPFQPDTAVTYNLVAMAGADVDYDLLYRGDPKVKKQGAAELFWLTVGGVRNPDKKDMVLALRGLARGRAMGNTLPHMHRAQIDALCKMRRLVFDDTNIPAHHEFLKYYDTARVARLADAAVALADPTHHSVLLDRLTEVINAPADPKQLVKFFTYRDIAISYYTLWRLENEVCGQTRHLSDGYLERIVLLLSDDPKQIERERKIGPCKVVRDGWFPTQAMMTRAYEQRPKTPGMIHGGFDF